MTRPGLDRMVAVAAATLFGAGTAYLGGELATVTHPARTEQTQYADPVPPLSPGDSSVQPTATGVPSLAPVAVHPSTPTAIPVREPERVSLRRLGIDMPVQAHGVDPHGRMALPEDPAVAGWYRFGPAPTSSTGAVVIAAHVDSRAHGVGPFRRLSSAQPGDEVLVTAGASRWHYQVLSVDRPAKRALDEAALFTRDGAPRLHLVTCTGRYQRETGYDANLVVVATLVRGP